ncbi:DEAD/DEAH box helicase [Mesorhizobium sp. BR1-1-3]|uniref:DEAD/DEAH box helicase n=1 Tax=Mesorhizobium sp. BR1-1-3 TaxID=2876651 RepID=UPI001CD0FB59|nr:DEAD/DEAH box helicase [Mesorhizobium sp. BR1-1-3]MBZ9888098.1 DEAD/DEAH box helicase [Mesorhizobium sp. BR1-1-3]
MLELRTYQTEAEQAIFDYWSEEAGNPLVVAATGTGKSLLMASLIKRLVEGWPELRLMVATHVAELIEQNYLELLGVWPFAPAGIFSAGLGRRDAHSQIIFAGIQTVHRHAKRIGHIDVLLVDECHLIPTDGNTMYRRFIEALREINPDLKIVGLTATPFRLDSGRLDDGDDRLFDRVVYDYGIAEGIRDGYLCRLSSLPTATEYDMRGVAKLGGDYKQSAMQAAVDKDELTRAVVAETVAAGADRRSWLLFCSGVDHAFHVRDAIRGYGITCETITGETPKDERRRILEDFKAYRIRAVTNNSVLTTGFNHKGVDLIAAMRPTKSASLFVQMMGRGTRPLYAPGMPVDTVEHRLAAIAAGPKPNCLVLDFAKLVNEHGPVDTVQAKEPGSGDGDAPFKVCPQEQTDPHGKHGCGEKIAASARHCPGCDFEFPEPKLKLAAQAEGKPILSKDDAKWRPVSDRRFDYHEGKGEKPPSVKVSYTTGMTAIREWLCPQHSGFAKSKADRWWASHQGQRPFPKTVLEWLERQRELLTTAEISVQPDGKYWTIKDVRPGTERAHADNDNEPVATNDNYYSPGMREVLDDDIPF